MPQNFSPSRFQTQREVDVSNALANAQRITNPITSYQENLTAEEVRQRGEAVLNSFSVSLGWEFGDAPTTSQPSSSTSNSGRTRFSVSNLFRRRSQQNQGDRYKKSLYKKNISKSFIFIPIHVK